MCGSRAGWKTYCSINHVPFFSATHSTRRLSETEATFCQPLCKKCEGDKYSSEQIQSLVELHLFWYLNLFQIMFPLLVSSLADTVLTISIYQEPEMCAVFKQNPFSPVLYIKWKDTGRRRRGMSICVCLMCSGISVFQGFVQHTRRPKWGQYCHVRTTTAKEKEFLLPLP